MLSLFLRERTDLFAGHDQDLLDIAPTPYLRRWLSASPKIRYFATDLRPGGNTAIATDLTAAGLRSASFDFVVCFHVLEHIPDDRAAMSELRRIARHDGCVVLQVPLREASRTEEDPTASPAEKLRRFGKDDHVRYYGLDVVDRLEDAGFRVECNRPAEWLGEERYHRHGLAGDDQVLLICRPAT